MEVEISRGPVPVQVPGVQSMALSDALAEVAGAGLAGSVVFVNDNFMPRDTVRLQDPPRAALVPPGSTVNLEVSGGPRAVVVITPPVIPAGQSAQIGVSIRDVDGRPLDPQPAVTLSLDIDPAALAGTPPTLAGSTIATFADSQGPFTVEASFVAETVQAEAVITQPISDGPGGRLQRVRPAQLAEYQQIIERADRGDR